MTTRRPAELFHPGIFMAEEMAFRNWTAGQLADVSDIDLITILQLIGGSIPVDQEIAEKLAVAFGTSPQFWLNLQDMWERMRGHE